MFGWFSSNEYQSVRSTSSSEDEEQPPALTIATQPNGGGGAAHADAEPKSAVAAGIEKMKGMFGLAPSVPVEDRSFVDDLDDMMTLTKTQRLYGFGITFVIGWVLSIMSLFAVPQIMIHPEKFALLYTCGNIISLCSTAFLWGPWQQIKDMFKPIRAVATIVYLVTMVITFVCAFKIWYCASYIPYGHAMITSFFTACCSICFR